MRSIFQEIVSLPARKRLKVSDMERRANELLDAIEDRVNMHGDLRAKLLLNDSRQIMSDYVNWQPQERLSWLYKNRELLRGHEETNRMLWETTELRIAELEAYIGKAREAIEVYRRFHPTIDDVVKRGYLYANAYIIIAITAHD